MRIIETERLILRDLIESDIERRIEWETTDREWQQWDGPWEYEGLTEEEEKEGLKVYVQRLHQFVEKYEQKSPEDIRYSYQIEVKETGEYIGWINCYCIDDDYTYTEGEGKYTFGIDLPAQSSRGKGYGYEAFSAVLGYQRAHGLQEIYTQTWSGNVRMIALAKKLGFVEVGRKKDYRTVRGEKYDGLTFRYEAEES